MFNSCFGNIPLPKTLHAVDRLLSHAVESLLLHAVDYNTRWLL